jgi:uncharacterized protein with HEPN domain
MLVYAKEILHTTSGITFESYLADPNLRLATERRLEIIGEAARNVSRAFQEAHPEIPWRRIIGLRHIMAHEYGEIRQERVFAIAVENIPDLIEALEPLVPPPPSGSEA